MGNKTKTPGDHDLLVRIDERVGTLTDEIKEIKDVHLRELRENVLEQISILQEAKMDKSTVEIWKRENDKLYADFEKRLRRVEQWGWIAIGGLTVLEIIIKFLR